MEQQPPQQARSAGNTEPLPPNEQQVADFWAAASRGLGMTRLDVVVGMGVMAAVVPPAWSFGWTAAEADELVSQVLAGIKTATASARQEYQDEDAALPAVGTLSIICDGAGKPHAVVRTEKVEVMTFDQVDLAQAKAEGFTSVAQWRQAHAPLLADRDGNELDPAQCQVVLESLKVIYPKPRRK